MEERIAEENYKMPERKKILIASNMYQIDPVCYASHLDMFYKLGRCKDLQIITFLPWRTPIDKARNDAVRMALAYEAEVLFFYDDDMFFGDATIAKNLIYNVLNTPKINVVQAVAYIRGYPFKPMTFKIIDIEDRKQMVADDTPEDLLADVDEHGFVKRDAVGCCATAIRVEVFKNIPAPWFLTGEKNTEDIYFCAKLREYLTDAGVYVNTNYEVGHHMDKPILTSTSRKMLLEMHEKYRVDQCWLPDTTFVDRMALSKDKFKFEERPNPFLEMDRLPFVKEETSNEGRKD